MINQEHGIVLHVQEEGYQPPITFRSGVARYLKVSEGPHPPTHPGGPGGQQDQEHGVVLHVQEEGYQPPQTSRTESSQVPQGLSMTSLPTQVDSEIKDMG